MSTMTPSLLLLATCVAAHFTTAARVTNPKKVPKNAVLLSKVKSLTVRAGQKTTSRRVSPVPQLQCVGPANVCKLYSPEVMRCSNEGADYDEENIQWSCKASLPEEFKLGSTDVSCEGYESSEDPYVLKGSCGVEYRLLLTEQGEAKYGHKQYDEAWGSGKPNAAEKYAGYLFMAIFLAVLFFILRGVYRAWRDDSRRPGRVTGWGGGGGGSNDDPPPPYDPYPHDYTPPKKPRTATPRATSSRSTSSNQQPGWRPGFWTGAATGATAGYMAGRRQQTRQAQETMQRRTGGGLFGGGGGSGWGGPSPAGPSNSSPSYSSTRHESTGFGSTSRR